MALQDPVELGYAQAQALIDRLNKRGISALFFLEKGERAAYYGNAGLDTLTTFLRMVMDENHELVPSLAEAFEELKGYAFQVILSTYGFPHFGGELIGSLVKPEVYRGGGFTDVLWYKDGRVYETGIGFLQDGQLYIREVHTLPAEFHEAGQLIEDTDYRNAVTGDVYRVDEDGLLRPHNTSKGTPINAGPRDTRSQEGRAEGGQAKVRVVRKARRAGDPKGDQ